MKRLILAVLLLAAAPAVAEEPIPETVLREQIPGPGGPITRLLLPGGPTVLLQPSPGASGVAVALCVPGGSRLDPADRGGLAHLVEHLVFRATPKFSAGRLPLAFEAVGARTGARTTPEAAVFWEVVPARQVDLALQVEADRLDGLTFSMKDLERERGLVLGELTSASAERQVEGYLRRMLAPGQPQEHVLPAGSAEEVRAITPDDLRAFYERGYRRDRAVLTVTGGFDPAAVEAKISELFPAPKETGAAPTPAPMVAAPPEAPPEAPKVTGGPLMVALPAPALDAADFAPLALLDAALTDGGTSRLARALQGKATLVPDPDLDDEVHRFTLRLAKGVPPAEVDRIVKAELARLGREDLAPAELESARRRALARFYRSWQDLAVRASTLAEAEAAQRLEDLVAVPERLIALKSAPLREAAARLLAPTRLKSYLPEAGERPAPPDAGPGAGEAQAGPVLEPGAEEVAPAGPSAPAQSPFVRRRLENGLTVLVWPDHSLPTITVRGYLLGGVLLDPPASPGLTSLCARLLGRGTDTRAGETFEWEVEERGMRLQFKGDRQVVTLEGWCLKEDLPRFADLLADALRNPRPGPESLERARAEALAEIDREALAGPNEAAREFYAHLYPEGHPYGRATVGTADAVRSASADQIAAHMAKLSRPDRLVLSFVGDATEAQVMAALRPDLTAWFAEGQAPRLEAPEAPMPPAGVYRFPAPGPGALVLMGHPGPSRRDPDYYAFNLLNQILGGNPATSRLALRIRDDENLGSASSRLIPMAGPVPWAVVLQVRADAVDRAVAVTREEMARLASEPPTQDEVTRAVESLTGRLQVGLADPAARADLLCNLEHYHLSEAYADGFAGFYTSITPQQIQAVAKARLRPENLVVVISGPEGEKPK